ncbi:cis-aconitate decarboxylase [Ornithorhynchus anatinus]|nr:cis-aconitate decarboxylase [Ornithorhynchus anatinus]
MALQSATESFSRVIHGLTTRHLTERLLHRSKRMILDTLGVGLIGTGTEVFHKVTQYSKIFSSNATSTVWGHSDFRLPPAYAAFVNGVAVHSMDFDDTWHPATHPSGAVLPVLIALSEALPQKPKISGLDLLLAFNVGIEVQGRLMRFSNEASDIPKRFHPPAVVGTLGSAAAAAKLLGLEPAECREALAIAASYAGAPMANAATQTKPLHVGNAARHGLEAARLAFLGLRGNPRILDLPAGFGAFYSDYGPEALPALESYPWLLDRQDVATKRFPAHLGTHWVADAASAVGESMAAGKASPPGPEQIERIVLRVPDVRYVDRPFPESEHEARHSFQFVACAALLDGGVSVRSFHGDRRDRPRLRRLLERVRLEHPPDNRPNFDTLYCEVSVTLRGGETFTERCDAFYGHWRKPLSPGDLEDKFRVNASTALCPEAVEAVVKAVDGLEALDDCSLLTTCLKGTSSPKEGSKMRSA